MQQTRCPQQSIELLHQMDCKLHKSHNQLVVCLDTPVMSWKNWLEHYNIARHVFLHFIRDNGPHVTNMG